MTIDTAMLSLGQGWISFLSRFEAKSGLHGGGGGGGKGGACARLWGILGYFGLIIG